MDTLLRAAKGESAARVRAIKMRDKALGRRNVPQAADRLIVELVLPLSDGGDDDDAGAAAARAPIFVCLSKQWRVGKALDVCAELGRVTNRNNEAGARKLHLIDLKTGEPLKNGAKVADSVKSGETLLLEYLDTTDNA